MRNAILFLLAAALGFTMIAGCGPDSGKTEDGSGTADSSSTESTVSSSSVKEEEDTYVIAFSIGSREPEERWDDELAAFQERTEEENCRVRILDAGGDAQKQAEQCSALLNSETVDVLVCRPVDREQASAVVSSAHDVGVPVIAYEDMILNAPPDYYVCCGTEPDSENEPRRNLALAAAGLACMTARSEYPQAQDMGVEGSWTGTASGNKTVPTFSVSDPVGSDEET